MKKILSILLLAVLLVFGAGCLGTAEDPISDEIIGTWEYTDAFETSTLIFNSDNTGTITSETPDQYKTTPTIWQKLESVDRYSKDAYFLDELFFVTFNEDGTMTDRSGYRYILKDGAEKIGGTWIETPIDLIYNTYVFNEDGTGILSLYGEDEGESERLAAYAIVWEPYGENQITYQYCFTYYFDENGVFYTAAHKDFTLIDGVWTTKHNGEILTYEFFDNGLAVRSMYSEETGEKNADIWMQWENNADGRSGQGTYANPSIIQLLDDGTLIDSWDQVYQKIS